MKVIVIVGLLWGVMAHQLEGEGNSQPKVLPDDWKQRLMGKIGFYLDKAGVKIGDGANTTVIDATANDRPVIVITDKNNNIYHVGIFELSFSATNNTTNVTNSSPPVITYGPVRPGEVSVPGEKILLNTSDGELYSMMDNNKATGPFFVTPEGGRHNGLIAMYLELAYPTVHSFASIEVTPFFAKTGSEGSSPTSQRLIINSILVDGKEVLKGNPIYTNGFGTGIPLPASDSDWKKPKLVMAHLVSKIITFPQTEGKVLRIEWENPYRSDHDHGGRDTFSLGIRELEIK